MGSYQHQYDRASLWGGPHPAWREKLGSSVVVRTVQQMSTKDKKSSAQTHLLVGIKCFVWRNEIVLELEKRSNKWSYVFIPSAIKLDHTTATVAHTPTKKTDAVLKSQELLHICILQIYLHRECLLYIFYFIYLITFTLKLLFFCWTTVPIWISPKRNK